MKIQAVKCHNCGDIIYSRARHDYRGCSCYSNKAESAGIAVDGGFDYFKMCMGNNANFEHVEIEVDATKKELYDDWNSFDEDKFGLIKCEDESEANG